MMAAETTSEAANANQRLLPMANTPLPTDSSLVAYATPVAIFLSLSLVAYSQAEPTVLLMLTAHRLFGPKGGILSGWASTTNRLCPAALWHPDSQPPE
jgi:hypothetical protein